MKKKPHSNLENVAFSNLENVTFVFYCLYFALNLGALLGNVIDSVVMGLLIGWLLWNMILLTRRLHRNGGDKALWHLLRTVLFRIVALFNPLWLRHEYGWPIWMTGTFLVVATLDSIALFKKDRASVALEPAPEVVDSPPGLGQ